ncbi:MAG: 2-oxo acid dehydrogenase subunit E2 [Clostridia bacterium]|nr:2-oxo acid dehydrogenase subunit E2 [Clostridia bacterium]
MASLIVMPKLGLTMKEGQLVKWNKAEGDEVNPGEVLFEVATDKLTNTVEANEKGFMRKLLANEGDVIACLKPVAIIGDKDEDISALLWESPEKGEAGESSVESGVSKVESRERKDKPKRVKVSPIAKKLAMENNIDVYDVAGTGPNGRITKEDVEKYLKKKKKIKSSPMAVKTAQGLGVNLSDINKDERIMKEDVLEFSKERKFLEAVNPKDERVPMSQMRKVISQRMSQSWNVSPAVTYDIKVDVTNLKKLKNDLKDIEKLTYTDFLVKIAAKVLLEFPLVNCSIDGETLILRNYVNMGVAVALENGLMVPVIKYANAKGLKDISSEIKDLSYKAKTNRLSTDELTGGTFTITNLGMFGIDAFSPIINQPEVAILGVNAISEVPVLENGTMIQKPFMKLSFTADHRAVDGAVGAQFLYRLKQYIENPAMLML